MIEQAMGHQVGTQVERAYRRTDVLDKRRQLMDDMGAVVRARIIIECGSIGAGKFLI